MRRLNPPALNEVVGFEVARTGYTHPETNVLFDLVVAKPGEEQQVWITSDQAAPNPAEAAGQFPSHVTYLKVSRDAADLPLCIPCLHAETHGWFGATIPPNTTHCRDCHATFPRNNRWGHCRKCCETFSGVRAFEDHHTVGLCGSLSDMQESTNEQWKYRRRTHRLGFRYWGSQDAPRGAE